MSLLDTASLVITPNGTKAGKLYSVVPSSGAGDMTVTRATTATRVNSAGLIESVASDVPRLDYSNGTCPSILVEPQRTNILPYSEDFSNAIWLRDGNGFGSVPIITSNYATSPSGNNTADRIQFSNVGGSGSDSNYSLVAQYPLAISSVGTATIYLKSNTSSNQNVLMYWGAGQGQVFIVTPQWQRFTLPNLSISGLTNIAFGTRGGSGQFYTGGDESLDILVWGAQLEAGSYATSYIPTTSASVTRNADVISKTGISSLIGQTEGTLYCDVLTSSIELDDYQTFVSVFGNGNNRVVIGKEQGTSNLFYYVNANGSVTFQIITNPLGRYKIALGYKNGDSCLYINGVSVFTSSNALTFSTALTDFYINQRPTGFEIGKLDLNTSALWKTRLTNTQLAQLTTI